MSDPNTAFRAFTRQNEKFIESFSIGLRYRTNDPRLGTITLARYNGPHGSVSRPGDAHFTHPHIHRMTAEELLRGHTPPKRNTDCAPTVSTRSRKPSSCSFVISRSRTTGVTILG